MLTYISTQVYPPADQTVYGCAGRWAKGVRGKDEHGTNNKVKFVFFVPLSLLHRRQFGKFNLVQVLCPW